MSDVEPPHPAEIERLLRPHFGRKDIRQFLYVMRKGGLYVMAKGDDRPGLCDGAALPAFIRGDRGESRGEGDGEPERKRSGLRYRPARRR